MENTRPGNHDRAWNDPPLFDYNTSPASGAVKTSTATKLNKRIGFPSTSQPLNPSKSTSSSDASMPPLPPSMPPPSASAINVPDCKESSDEIESKVTTSLTAAAAGDKVDEVNVEDVISKLETSLMAAQQSGRIDAKKASEIRKRIGMLQDKWSRNQLNEKLHHGMFKLTACLAEDNFDEAEKIQRSLNVDYPNLCTPWMIAIRQLILAQQSKGQ